MTSTPARGRRLGVTLLLAGGALALRPAPLAAQSFAAGLGAAVYAETATDSDVKGFQNWGGDAYLEVLLESSYSFATVLEGRYSRFQLPGSQPGAPNLQVNAGIARVSYRWRDDWFQAGFFGGGGVFCVSPKSPGPGEIAVDSSETAAGATFGVETLFRLTRQIDFRLEFGGDYIATTVIHRPLFIGGSVSYKF
jgi:hypothetical protein